MSLACPIVGVRDKNVIYPPSFPQHVDRTLAHLHISKNQLDAINEAGAFESADFELDGVRTVDADGTHAMTPEPIRKGFEWRQFGTAALGLRWRRVAVSEEEEIHESLDDKIMDKQLRMTKRAYDAFGKDPGFIISDEDRTKRLAALRVREQLSLEARERNDAVNCIQAKVRRQLLAPLYPWYHVTRLALSNHPSHSNVRKKTKSSHTESNKSLYTAEMVTDFQAIPDIPWCVCWLSLESIYELDEKSAVALQQLVTDFKSQVYETCLRRVDNLIFIYSSKSSANNIKQVLDEKVLIELAALCNRFALRLFHLGKVQIAHAFFSRVLSFTHMTSPGDFPGKHEFFAWTCDLIALCLWKQGKYEKAHISLTRSAQHSVPVNAGVVARLHSCQLLFKLQKHDLVIKLGTKLLVDLLQARNTHKIAVFKGSTLPDDDQMLRIIEFDDERGRQSSAPFFLNLICHAGLTLAMALHKKARDTLRLQKIQLLDHRGNRTERQFIVDFEGEGRFLHQKAETVAQVVLRQVETSPMMVSEDLKICCQQYCAVLKDDRSRFGTTVNRESFRKTALLFHWLGLCRQQKSTATGRTRLPPPIKQGSNAHHHAARGITAANWAKASESLFLHPGGDTSMEQFSHQSRSKASNTRASIAAAGCTYEPSHDWTWASEFYGDVYWQRAHSNFDSGFSGLLAQSSQDF